MMMIRRRRDRPGISASAGQAVNRTDLDQEAEGSLPRVQLWLALHKYILHYISLLSGKGEVVRS